MNGINMTRGSIVKGMLLFAWPIMLGLLLQQFYNTIDAVVVGKYVGANALAAVGSVSGSLVNVVISFAFGLFAGANVLVSQFFGADDHKSLREVVHMEMLLSALTGVFLAAVGYVFTPALLMFIKTPVEVYPGAVTYLRIFFIGLPALFIYNAGASILTALGDSKSPLIYLAITTVLNIGGDLFFVLALDMGIAGVAWATVLAEIVSVGMVVWTMCRARASYRLRFRELRLHPALLKKAAAIGIPGGIQGTIVSLSNFSVQSYLNGLGAITLAGYASSSRIDAFAAMPVQAMAAVVATFVGQNLGAQKVARARSGVKQGTVFSVFITLAMSAVTLTLGRPLLGIFNSDPAVIDEGFLFMLLLAPFYCIQSCTQVLPGALRGAGDVRFATGACIASFVVIRQIYLFIISRIEYTAVTVGLCYPATWFLAGLAILIYYLRTDWSKFEADKPASDGLAPSASAAGGSSSNNTDTPARSVKK